MVPFFGAPAGRRALAAAGVLALALVACSHAPILPLGKEVPLEKTSFSFESTATSFELFENYLVKPGDLLDVLLEFRTWTEKPDFKIAIDQTVEVKFVQPPQYYTIQQAPNIDQSQRVRPDGTISLPYIGNIRVIGLTVEQLTKELNQRYATILRDPNIYIVVPDFDNAIKELKADLHTAPRGLSRLATVRPDGFITFPLVGDLAVAGKSIPQISKDLNERMEPLLPGLHCDVFLEQHAGSVIYVTGEVHNSGAHRIANPVSLVQALALAGGPTNAARLDNVVVIRKHEKRLVATRIDVGKNFEPGSGSAFFYLMPDDIVLVPRSRLAEAADVARSIGDIIFFRGWSLGFTWELRDMPDTGKVNSGL
jgi:polysaccharide export outer membrane protein